MKIIDYTSIIPTSFESDQVKGVAGRVVVGKNDGANNFCMRIFEIGPGGNTPKHAHPWEHEMFIHAGVGEIFGNGQWNPLPLFINTQDHKMTRLTRLGNSRSINNKFGYFF